VNEKRALGKVHVITGPGKGKTTAAFGLAMRAAGHGLRVCVIQFMKCGETTGEVRAARSLPNIEVAQYGTGRFVSPDKPSEEDLAMARRALDHAAEAASSGHCDMLVLDEINVVTALGLVQEAAVLDILRSRRDGVEVILTGRNAPDSFVEFADYVMHIQDVKHPFEEGTAARMGVEW